MGNKNTALVLYILIISDLFTVLRRKENTDGPKSHTALQVQLSDKLWLPCGSRGKGVVFSVKQIKLSALLYPVVPLLAPLGEKNISLRCHLTE